MNKTRMIYGTMATILMAMVLIIATSCSKEEQGAPEAVVYSEQNGKVIKDVRIQERIKELAGKLPTVVVYNRTMDKYISLDLNNPKSFTFSNPTGGLSFSSPQGSVQFVSADGGQLQVITTPASAGGGGGGGLVAAGDVTLDVNYVVCFASGDPGADFNIFDIGPGGDGVSGAFGIAGNFEMLAEGEFEEDDIDPTEILSGFVAYLVLDGTADGSYPVINFFDEADGQGEDNDEKAIAYLISFQDAQLGIFFSNSGNLTFSGSSVEFDGTYVGLVGEFLLDLDDDDEDAFDFIEVTGSGFLECN